MSDIVEIFGENKFVGSENKSLKSRVVLEEPSKLKNEYNLFNNVSQLNQFIVEKQENEVYKVYGTIIPSVMKDAFFRNTKLNIDTNSVEFNKDNWSLVMCKPIKYSEKEKGKKSFQVKYNDSGTKSYEIFELDLSKGLPASLSTLTGFRFRNGNSSEVNITLYMNLGHNLNPGDQIHINSEDDRVPTGVCSVNNVSGNEITTSLTINSAKLITPLRNAKMITNNNLKFGSFITPPTTPSTSPNQYTGVVKGIQTTTDISELVAQLKADRPAPYALVNPKMTVSKVIDNEVLEYYVKQVEVVEAIYNLDECGFSKTIYGEKIYNFYFNENYNIKGLLDNKDEPITKSYIGIIKNGSTEDKPFTSVESNFSTFIDYTNPGEGIKTITRPSTSNVSDKPTVGNTYDIGIYEYSSENLTEELVEYVEHNFILNNVMFKYKPFTEITLRNISSYIEDSESRDFIPTYAKYSRNRGKFIWRDLIDIGVSDEDGTILDFPFLNGCRYSYNRIPFNVLIEKNRVKKYKLNVNDVSNIDSVNSVDSYLRSITDDLFGNSSTDNNKPYIPYTKEEC